MEYENIIAIHMLHKSITILTPFKRQTHKMVKHTQTIRRPLATNCLSVWPFVDLALKELTFVVPRLPFISMFSIIIQ